MAQLEQTRLSFTAARTGTNYIDITKALTLINGKHYTQFVRDKPQAFTIVARAVNTANSIETAQVSWVVRNALVKTAAAWRAMLKKAGITKKDLNTYGKELRMSLDHSHRSTWGGLTMSQVGGITHADLVPDHLVTTSAPNDTNLEYDTGMCDAQDNNVYATAFSIDVAKYNTATQGVFREHAFDLTELTVPEGAGGDGSSFWQPYLVGSGQGAINTYIDSRKRSAETHDDDLDNMGDDSDNYINLMLSDEPDDVEHVVEDVHDLGDFKPYDLDYQNKLIEVVKPGANVAGQDTAFVAPLGLMRWTASANDEIIITVTGKMDM